MKFAERERAQHAPLAARLQQPRRDDRAAAAAGAGGPLLGRDRERHAVEAVEDRVARGRARGIEAREQAGVVLAQADRHEPPVELVAVAPLEHAERRVRGVRPGAGRIGVRASPSITPTRLSLLAQARRIGFRRVRRRTMVAQQDTSRYGLEIGRPAIRVGRADHLQSGRHSLRCGQRRRRDLRDRRRRRRDGRSAGRDREPRLAPRGLSRLPARGRLRARHGGSPALAARSTSRCAAAAATPRSRS